LYGGIIRQAGRTEASSTANVLKLPRLRPDLLRSVKHFFRFLSLGGQVVGTTRQMALRRDRLTGSRDVINNKLISTQALYP